MLSQVQPPVDAVIFNKDLCYYLLLFLSPKFLSTSMCVCKLWCGIAKQIREIRDRKRYSLDLKFTQIEGRFKFRWKYVDFGGIAPIVDKIVVKDFLPESKGYGILKLNTKKQKWTTQWFYMNGRRDMIRPRGFNIFKIHNDDGSVENILNFNKEDSLHQSFKKLKYTHFTN